MNLKPYIRKASRKDYHKIPLIGNLKLALSFLL